MMSEAIDETLDKDEAEEETEELTNQVECCLLFLVLLQWVVSPTFQKTILALLKLLFTEVVIQIGVPI